jgi:hypothetical protein
MFLRLQLVTVLLALGIIGTPARLQGKELVPVDRGLVDIRRQLQNDPPVTVLCCGSGCYGVEDDDVPDSTSVEYEFEVSIRCAGSWVGLFFVDPYQYDGIAFLFSS